MRPAFPVLATLACALALSACGDANSETGEDEAAEPVVVSACNPITFEDARFTHCVADPARHTVHTALLDDTGQPFRSIADYAASRGAGGDPVAFAVNAGMFDNSGKPIGYYVEDGRRLEELNRKRGPGNFHLLPNGVFYGEAGKWHVSTSDAFYENVTQRPDFGTQSGPMLVIDGEMHPDLDEDGPSRFVRNGVGVDEAGRAHFVISDEPVSFGKLARLYRDELDVPNALYLDGSVSALWDPARERLDYGAPLGPLLVVLDTKGEARDPAATKADAGGGDAP
jgi:uncharacterized protein YigE (DUF2233 family)